MANIDVIASKPVHFSGEVFRCNVRIQSLLSASSLHPKRTQANAWTVSGFDYVMVQLVGSVSSSHVSVLRKKDPRAFGVWGGVTLLSSEDAGGQSKLLFVSDPTVICTDISLLNERSNRWFGYECRIPPFVPPSFSGKMVKYTYYLLLVAQARLTPAGALRHRIGAMRGEKENTKGGGGASRSRRVALRLPINVLGPSRSDLPLMPTLGLPILPDNEAPKRREREMTMRLRTMRTKKAREREKEKEKEKKAIGEGGQPDNGANGGVEGGIVASSSSAAAIVQKQRERDRERRERRQREEDERLTDALREVGALSFATSCAASVSVSATSGASPSSSAVGGSAGAHANANGGGSLGGGGGAVGTAVSAESAWGEREEGSLQALRAAVGGRLKHFDFGSLSWEGGGAVAQCAFVRPSPRPSSSSSPEFGGGGLSLKGNGLEIVWGGDSESDENRGEKGKKGGNWRGTHLYSGRDGSAAGEGECAPGLQATSSLLDSSLALWSLSSSLKAMESEDFGVGSTGGSSGSSAVASLEDLLCSSSSSSGGVNSSQQKGKEKEKETLEAKVVNALLSLQMQQQTQTQRQARGEKSSTSPAATAEGAVETAPVSSSSSLQLTDLVTPVPQSGVNTNANGLSSIRPTAGAKEWLQIRAGGRKVCVIGVPRAFSRQMVPPSSSSSSSTTSSSSHPPPWGHGLPRGSLGPRLGPFSSSSSPPSLSSASCGHVGLEVPVVLDFSDASVETLELHLALVRKETVISDAYSSIDAAALSVPLSVPVQQNAANSSASSILVLPSQHQQESRGPAPLSSLQAQTQAQGGGGGRGGGEQDGGPKKPRGLLGASAAAGLSLSASTVSGLRQVAAEVKPASSSVVLWERKEVTASSRRLIVQVPLAASLCPSFHTDAVEVSYELHFCFHCLRISATEGKKGSQQGDGKEGGGGKFLFPEPLKALTGDRTISLDYSVPLVVLPPLPSAGLGGRGGALSNPLACEVDSTVGDPETGSWSSFSFPCKVRHAGASVGCEVDMGPAVSVDSGLVPHLSHTFLLQALEGDSGSSLGGLKVAGLPVDGDEGEELEVKPSGVYCLQGRASLQVAGASRMCRRVCIR